MRQHDSTATHQHRDRVLTMLHQGYDPDRIVNELAFDGHAAEATRQIIAEQSVRADRAFGKWMRWAMLAALLLMGGAFGLDRWLGSSRGLGTGLGLASLAILVGLIVHMIGLVRSGGRS